MQKIFSFLFPVILSTLPAGAQTQAEIDKMIRDANELAKKYSSDSAIKKAISDQQKNNTGNSSVSYTSDPGSYGNVDNWKFPSKNTVLLSSIPKKIFTKAELISFLNDIYGQLSKKLTPGVAASVQSIAAKYHNDGNAMGDAAVMGWYSDYREESILLIIKASANNPDNELLLNNCATILNMSGIEQKAIPILKYILQSNPGSSMVLNNLGQAYAGLGETDTAMVYFGRCLKIEPEHPEACGTAGFIEESKGNTEKAIEYFEKSIKTAYSKPVQFKLRKIKKGSKIANLVRPRVKLPEYFNLFKYHLPAQCISTDNAAVARAEHDAFRKTIMKQAQMYGGKWAELAQKKAQDVMQMKANGVGRKLNKGEFMAQPFYELCNIMAANLMTDYIDEMRDLSSRVFKKYNIEIDALEKEYQSKRKSLQEAYAGCAALNNLANQYLPKFAELTIDMQKKGMLVHQKYFDELAYWHYLSLNPTGADNFKLMYYHLIDEYLALIGGICRTKIIDPCEYAETTASKESNEINEIDCPVDVELAFGIGKLQLNCEKFSFRVGEGVIFEYEKVFKTRQSTLSVGIGIKFDLGVKAGPAKAIVGAKAAETVFITFDGNNGIADIGLENEAKLTAHVTGVVKENITIGSRFGINSGWDFNEGPFKGLVK